MRYSPYAMQDYGLQHRGGAVCPLPMKQYDEAMWNLIWASTPELDKYLDIAYEDFSTFKKLNLGFPFENKIRADRLLTLPGMRDVFAVHTPQAAFRYTQERATGIRLLHGATADTWMSTVAARLGMAQTLVDLKEAEALCQSIMVVDFRARRRL